MKISMDQILSSTAQVLKNETGLNIKKVKATATFGAISLLDSQKNEILCFHISLIQNQISLTDFSDINQEYRNKIIHIVMDNYKKLCK